MHTYQKTDIKVDDRFIAKFADQYVKQRSLATTPVSSLASSPIFKNTGYDTSELQKIITKNVIAQDKEREKGLTPAILNDIYRSDLGELLMTYYYEEKVSPNDRFIIPVKNITSRELSHLPGRGMDAIGYRLDGTKVNILFGEAKVSSFKDSKNPPSVVHANKDSMYKTHLTHLPDKSECLKKLSEYFKRLSGNDAAAIGFAILAIEKKLVVNYQITFGCTLVRDHTCVNEAVDYGKLKDDQKKFEPGIVNFSLLSFTGKTIAEAVEMFYKQIYKLAA